MEEEKIEKIGLRMKKMLEKNKERFFKMFLGRKSSQG
jgi:hypothetical protein